MTMTAEKLEEILNRHMHWIREDCEGWKDMKADLSGADLSWVDLLGANLSGANLSGANLSWTDLSGANLSGANLSGADLRSANLSGADLCRVNLYEADLSGAELYGADLYGADLRRANLYGVNLYGADLSGTKVEMELINKFFPICCPEYGAFIGWKKARGLIIKLQIPEDAKRSSAFGRECRCSKAIVLGIETIDGSKSELDAIASEYDGDFIYRVGETVEVPDFDENRVNECAPGIHFFITRQEAVDYI